MELAKQKIAEWVRNGDNNESLDLSSLQLTELPELPAGLHELYCDDNALTELPELPDGLKHFDCDHNKLTKLPKLPAGLKYLNCYNNKLTRLVERVVEWSLCSHTNTRSARVEPHSGEDSEIGQQSRPIQSIIAGEPAIISELPKLPDGLYGLYCSDNLLTELPELPIGLTHLYCSDNKLTHLPELPDGLQELYCSHNALTELPELPATLEYLYCNNNALTHLPELPDGILHLYCSDNLLTELPELPIGLTHLYCDDNKLTHLPELPSSIEAISYEDNPLINVPVIPDSNISSSVIELNITPQQALPHWAAQILIVHKIAEQAECPISHTPLIKNNTVITNCFHLFDKESFVHWSQTGHTDCPVCRHNPVILSE